MDIEIEDVELAELQTPSIIRMKLPTLDHRLIWGRLGILNAKGKEQVFRQLVSLFDIHSCL